VPPAICTGRSGARDSDRASAVSISSMPTMRITQLLIGQVGLSRSASSASRSSNTKQLPCQPGARAGFELEVRQDAAVELQTCCGRPCSRIQIAAFSQRMPPVQ
jgi:hypothetical protein